MKGPKEPSHHVTPEEFAGAHQVGASHVEHMEAELDKVHPGHPNGEQSEMPQKARKILGSDEEPNR